MPSVGAVTSNLGVTLKTGTYTAKPADFVLADATAAPFTVTLPTGPLVNAIVAVKKVDASTNMVTVAPGPGALINGDTAVGLVVLGASATFQFDGTNWQLLSTGQINTANTAAGIPAGGTAGQVLAKTSATSYDAAWAAPATPSGLVPTGGAAGQVLTKNTATNYDAAWAAAAAGGFYIPWTSGRTFTTFPVAGNFSNGTWGYGPYLFPIRVPNACTIASLGLYFTANMGGTHHLALYSDTGAASTSAMGARIGYGTIVNGSGGWQFTSAMNTVFAAPTTVWVWWHTTIANSTGYTAEPGYAGGSFNMVLDTSGGQTTAPYTMYQVTSFTLGSAPPTTVPTASVSAIYPGQFISPHIFVKIA